MENYKEVKKYYKEQNKGIKLAPKNFDELTEEAKNLWLKRYLKSLVNK